MNDLDIINLFFERSERAIKETKNQYGYYIRTIAYNILGNESDTEEVESDTYMAAWNSIPPKMPNVLKHYLSRIARNLALKRVDYNLAEKRSCNAVLLLDELAEILPADNSVEVSVEVKELGEAINKYVKDLSLADRGIFIYRYYYAETYMQIAKRYGITQRQVKYRLSVMRGDLKVKLKKEGYIL